MKLLDERGIGTVWSICKEKFALVGHTHNYAGSGSPGGSANSAIGVVDYNQTGKTIQIGYSGTGITGDQIKYIAGYTDGSGNVNAKIKNVSKDALKSWLGLSPLPTASSTYLGCIKTSGSYDENHCFPICTNENGEAYARIDSIDQHDGIVNGYTVRNNSDYTTYSYDSINRKVGSGIISLRFPSNHGTLALTSNIPTKTSQLTNDSKFLTSADKYTLPVASENTLGGIKVSDNANGSSWPICVDNNGLANTKILGLEKHNNAIKRIILHGNTNNATSYSYNTIDIDCYSENNKLISLPLKTGTLALISDIPDVSSLCKLNFINSISECVNGRINFFFKISNDYVDLSFLSNLEEGTILLIYCVAAGFEITNKSGVWYYNGTAQPADGTAYIDRVKLTLAFFHNTYVYVSTFSY